MPRLGRRIRWVLFLVVAVVVILAGVMAYGVVQTYQVEVQQYTYTSPDVPAAFDGTRIVLVTDIHRGPFFSESRVGDLVERVNDLEPDLIVLGGDYVFGNTDYEASCFSRLAGLRAPLGCYAVLGNHDYGEPQRQRGTGEDDPSKALEAMAAAGIEALDDRAVWLERDGGRIRLGGVSDYQQGDPRVTATLTETSRDDLVILVSHNPDVAEGLPGEGIDLVVSGHTHGGQVALFGYAFYLPSEYGQKYRTGVIENGDTTVIVSNGIGTSTVPPVRLFVPPQIVIITLERADR